MVIISAEDVVALEHNVWNAVLQRDGQALEELFADDYLEVTLDGKRAERGEIMEKSPILDEIDSYAVDFERVIALGETSALLSYRVTLEGKVAGKTITPKQRWVASVWSKAGERWQCRFFQQSPYSEVDR